MEILIDWKPGAGKTRTRGWNETLTEGIDSSEDIEGEGAQKLKAQLADEKRRSEDYLTRLKYLQADFENYRKRADKELRDVEDITLRKLAMSLLGTVDELELAVRNAKESGAGAELIDGLEMVRKNLLGALEASGLSRIEAEGAPFDPSLHEAVERVQGSSSGVDVVTGEVRPGYLFRGRVLRPSMVKVELALKEPGEKGAGTDE